VGKALRIVTRAQDDRIVDSSEFKFVKVRGGFYATHEDLVASYAVSADQLLTIDLFPGTQPFSVDLKQLASGSYTKPGEYCQGNSIGQGCFAVTRVVTLE
jgi:hypothetical protein